ncbi:ATP-dependent RNA helicase DbpA [bioreactor metagenome]|uniref:ATP-dependent RNA helicase DbpA n=1 Tax=bioreactor metagenome TaxID=1076179 RepID=A0A644VVH1_9ZZZZ|nr:DEAD/DEAH box helicase [Methanobrevibacter sp.]MEA4957138.1 DEAD/DEAH box helicase [Methanobrevibacter sp.]
MERLAIDKFKNDIRFRHKIAHIEKIPGKEAIYMDLDNLNPKIAKYLEKNNISLYKHQAIAYKKIQNKKNIIITTPTASGKTLAFNLPILETMLNDKKATAMYIYPAKALSNDQLNILKNLEKNLDLEIKPATYDGDTPKNKKYGIRQNSRIVLTNPYQIHHILSWHHQWKRFYSNLKYIVIDEAHYYKGIFGSNVAYLIRRLKRIANFYGSSPQFILSSATLANPVELANKLVGEDFSLIDNDTSPSGDKDFIFYNPFYKNLKKNKGSNNLENDSESLGNIKDFEDKFIEDTIANNRDDNWTKITDGLSIHQETEMIFLYLLLKDIQTLCFTVSRKIAELIAMWTKKDMLTYKKPLAEKITAYRAGYLASERREIEEGLKNRKYLGVTCTNALELGINIGSLDAVIISGYPGTMISTWQQAGRAGRGNQKSVVILLAFENQLDQYFMKNPEFFFDKPHENAIVDLNNKMIIKSHILCAANELPITADEAKELFNCDESILNESVENFDLIKNKREQYIYSHDDEASFKHSLDQLSNDSFKVMSINGNNNSNNNNMDNSNNRSNNNYSKNENIDNYNNSNNYSNNNYSNRYNQTLLENMELGQVYREAHEGAVLINKGETYIVDSVNLKSRYVNVYKQAVEYHTIVLKDVDISIKSKIKKEKIGNFTVHFGELEVSEDFHKYKKLHFSKTLGTFNLDLPPLTFKTKGIWFTIPNEIKKCLEDRYNQDDVFAGGLHGVEHGLIGLFPLHVMCDRFDIGGLSTNYHEDTQEATIFIYDAYEGGIGICEKAIEVFNQLVQSTKDLIDNCQCESGCPSCIYSPKCGNENKPLHKDATRNILSYIKNEIDIAEKEEILNKINSENHSYDLKNNIKNNNNSKNNNINKNKTNNNTINKNNTKNNIKTKNNNINTNKKENNIKNNTKTKNNTINSTKNNAKNENNNNNKNNSNSENVQDMLKEALKLYKEKNYTFAKDLLINILDNDKKNSDSWYLLGAILNDQGDSNGAIKFLKKSISIDPANEKAHELIDIIKSQP